MTIRILFIALALLLFIAVIEQDKSLVKKGVELFFALVLLLINVIAELGHIHTLASQLNVEQLYMFAREILHAFGLTSSSLISLQMFALSAVAMFTLLWMECKRMLCIVKTEGIVATLGADNHTAIIDANEFSAFSRTYFYAKLRN